MTVVMVSLRDLSRLLVKARNTQFLPPSKAFLTRTGIFLALTNV